MKKKIKIDSNAIRVMKEFNESLDFASDRELRLINYLFKILNKLTEHKGRTLSNKRSQKK